VQNIGGTEYERCRIWEVQGMRGAEYRRGTEYERCGI
jgi:hypothetical protein